LYPDANIHICYCFVLLYQFGKEFIGCFDINLVLPHGKINTVFKNKISEKIYSFTNQFLQNNDDEKI